MTTTETLNLISLNIEGSLHLNRFPQLVLAEDPDVLCLQEVFEHDLQQIAELSHMPHYHFARKAFIPKEQGLSERDGWWGLAIFSKEPLRDVREVFYRRAESRYATQNYQTLTKDQRQQAQEGVMLTGMYHKGGDAFPVATLHFTWSFVTASELQMHDAHRLMAVLAEIPEIILCGDFNVPRVQNACYEIFAQELIDAIPRDITNSVDRALHKNGAKITQDLMVDYLFHTKQFQAQHVRLVDGVSDHMAIVAQIQRASFLV